MRKRSRVIPLHLTDRELRQLNEQAERSGLSREDLDVETSQHHLVTLKDAYSRLRRLVDRGCVFVGHGCGAAERR